MGDFSFWKTNLAGDIIWRKPQWFFKAFPETENTAVEFIMLICSIFFSNKMSRIEFFVPYCCLQDYYWNILNKKQLKQQLMSECICHLQIFYALLKRRSRIENTSQNVQWSLVCSFRNSSLWYDFLTSWIQ